MIARASFACVVLAGFVTACGDASNDAVRIASVSPSYGPLVGGTQIALTGAGFVSRDGEPDRVLIGGREAPLVAPIDDATLVVVIPPADQPGDAELVVLSGNGNARATGVFHYSTPPTLAQVTPANVLFSSSSTLLTVTGSGFLDEGAGDVSVVVNGQLATDVAVMSDRELTFTVAPGRALARPDLDLVDSRGSATLRRAFRYTPSTRSGLLLFPPFGTFAVFFDPVDNSSVSIPWSAAQTIRLTAVVRDEQGEYWGIDRSERFGRLDTTSQTLEAPIQTQGWFPTMIRVGNDYLTLERGSLRFGKLDPHTGSFTAIGAASIPCCGSYGIASDGTTLYFTARQAGSVVITPIDAATGVTGTPVPITAGPGFHVEEMRFFNGKLYASSRDGTLVVIDPITGATTILPVSLGRSSAMELFQ